MMVGGMEKQIQPSKKASLQFACKMCEYMYFFTDLHTDP